MRWLISFDRSISSESMEIFFEKKVRPVPTGRLGLKGCWTIRPIGWTIRLIGLAGGNRPYTRSNQRCGRRHREALAHFFDFATDRIQFRSVIWVRQRRVDPAADLLHLFGAHTACG